VVRDVQIVSSDVFKPLPFLPVFTQCLISQILVIRQMEKMLGTLMSWPTLVLSYVNIPLEDPKKTTTHVTKMIHPWILHSKKRSHF
jgi:hypothetical protein